VLSIQPLLPYSRHFIFFIAYEWAQLGRVLHCCRQEKFAWVRHTSLLGPLVNYEENESAMYMASEAGLLNKRLMLSSSKFISTRYMIFVTLCCATEVGLRCSTNPPLRFKHSLPVYLVRCSVSTLTIRVKWLGSYRYLFKKY
jgi:hypothetical protein